jgi:methylmalonyl-CoA mutase
LPKYEAWGDILEWCLQENVPGEFPFTSGLYVKEKAKIHHACLLVKVDQERTNKRFHYVSAGLPAKRLSTAFDSVTLYGSPHVRPDIYGKLVMLEFLFVV